MDSCTTPGSFLQGPALRKEPRSRKVDKCGTVFRDAVHFLHRWQEPQRNCVGLQRTISGQVAKNEPHPVWRLFTVVRGVTLRAPCVPWNRAYRKAGARKMTLLPMFRSLSVNQGCVHRDRFLNSLADW